MLEEAVDDLRQATGRKPMAFRAGCYAADRTTLRCVKRAGIDADLSYNASYPPCTQEPSQVINSPRQWEGILEIPVSQIIGNRFPWHGVRPFEIGCLSSCEIRSGLKQLHRGGQTVAVLVLHSFSLLKNRSGRWCHVKPDRVVLHRLKHIVAFLDEQRDRFRVARISECLADKNWVQQALSGREVWPTTSAGRWARRYIGQLISRL
jgi:hypothetical protein